MHLLCPHCRSPIELVKLDPRQEILCPSCGSAFRLETQATTSDAPIEGRTVGRFQLVEVVGHGAFGTVYRARDPELDRVVAVKVPRAGKLPGGQDLDRFLREARSAAQLRHPSVVSVYEVGQHDGTPYLVSEFVQGVTLADLLTARRPSPREAAELMAAVAEALQYAHEQGVYHRDVKPSNILLDEAGRPHVTDFGLAKREAGEITMTIDGQVLGTPAYMSPEQAAGEGHRVDGRSDVYSVGVMLYQLLTGEVPFRGNTRMLLHQVLHDEPRPPRSLNDRIPRDLETVCLKAMAKEPGRRYRTAGELAADLRRFLKGEPIVARPVGRSERLWRWCRRNPGLATAGGLAAAATLVTLVTFAVAFGLVTASRDDYKRVAADNASLAARNAAQAETERRLRREAERNAARLLFEQAYATCQPEDARPGMLRLCDSLEAAHAVGDAELERAIRRQLGAWYRAIHPLRAAFERFLGAPVAAVFSPDSKSVLTGSLSEGHWLDAGGGMRLPSFDDPARLWEVATGKSLDRSFQHTTSVGAVAFSPDGKTVLTGGSDNRAQRWEASTGKPVGPPLEQASPVIDVAFSPDGKTLVTATKDKTAQLLQAVTGKPSGQPLAQLWEAATGKRIGQPLPHDSEVRAVLFSPDGKTVLTAPGKNTAGLWDTSTGRAIGVPLEHSGEITAAVFSPDGKAVLTGSTDKTARLWKTATGKAIGPALKHPDEVSAVAFSPDSKVALTGSRDGKARLWKTATGERVGPPLAHQGEVTEVAVSPDGKAVLTASLASTARLWEAATGKPLGPALQHEGPVWAAAFSPDGKLIVTCDLRARLWASATGRPVGAPLQGRWGITSAMFSPDGNSLLTWGLLRKNTAWLWETTTPKVMGVRLQHAGSVMATAFSPDGKHVVTGGLDGNAQLWDVRSGHAVGPLRHGGSVFAVAFSRDGNTVLTADGDGEVRLWETGTLRELGAPRPRDARVTAFVSVAISPDRTRVLTWGRGNAARLREVGNGKTIGPLKDAGSVDVAAFSPDGKIVLTASKETRGRATARLWDAGTGRPIGRPLQHEQQVTAAAFSPDGNTVLTASEGRSGRGEAQLWEVGTGKPIALPLAHQGKVPAVAISPDGKTLLTGSEDKTARLWEATTGKPIGSPLQHAGGIVAVEFSPDGKTVVTGSKDKTARLWESSSGRAIGPPLFHAHGVEAVAFSPDGTTILTRDEEGAVRLWEVPRPVSGEVERVKLWAQVITGMELDGHKVARLLDAATWQQRRQRLEELGGPPVR